MDFLPALRAALGLPDTADQPAILATIRANQSSVAAHAHQVASIATAANLDAGTGADAIVTALQARTAGGTLEEMVALQSRIQELETSTKRRVAETAINAAIREGKPIPPAGREDFIARHMADPAGTDFWLSTMMSLNAGGLPSGPAPQAGVGLDSSEMQVISTLGIDPAAFLLAKQAKGTLH